MKARLLFDRRVIINERSFAELVAWKVPKSLAGSHHSFKYRLAFVVIDKCVVRFDNESGKGDHRHIGRNESPYTFTTIDKLVADFFGEVQRWRNENRNS